MPPQLLPEGSGAFLRRRLIELGGLAILAVALALFAACLTYAPGDPSFNRASDAPVANILGSFGAHAADLLLESLGLVAFLASVIIAGWAWRVLRDHRLPRWGLRLLLFLPTLLLLAVALAALPKPASWTFEGGLGGLLGDLLLAGLAVRLDLPPAPLGLGAAFAGLVAFFYTLALTGGEWRAGGQRLAWLVDSGARSIAERRRARRGNERAERDPRPAIGGERREPRLEPRLENPPAKAPPRTRERARPEAAEPPRARKARGDIVAPRAPVSPPGRRGREANQGRLDFGPEGGYELPPLALLSAPPAAGRDGGLDRDSLEKNARLLESVLEDFGVKGEIVKIQPGPVVTRYELEPAPGTKTSRVVGLADDIARSMSAVSVRVAVVPGASTIGIELPNRRRETVFLRELLGSQAYERASGKLPLILGKDIGGNPVIVDLARMPHLLIAGTTGSGKSVGVNSMILSLLYRFAPDQCKFILIDPKMLELSVYDDIPHLLSPVVTEPKKAVVALKWTVREMEERYRAMSRLGVRNIDGYNLRIAQALKNGEVLTRRVQTGFDPDTGQPLYEEQPFDLEPLPYIVVVVDEMADLMLVAGKDIEMAVQRLAQMARAAGIHLIMATQRPSVDVITGTIKANFPSRVSFHVTSKIDSRTILGEMGAEQLLGQGDMLYLAQGGRIFRVHGPLVTDQEVEEVVAFLKRQGQPSYIESVTLDEDEEFGGLAEEGRSGDDLYDRAVAVVLRHRKASTSFVQRHLQIGYNRAARLIERMEAEGVISGANHVGKREILLHSGEGD